MVSIESMERNDDEQDGRKVCIEKHEHNFTFESRSSKFNLNIKQLI